jgi:imidazolonepropionase-like amidohydrolase
MVTILRGASVFDAKPHSALFTGEVWIEGNRIRRVLKDSGGRSESPPEATVYDAGGCTVLPGLINLHAHIQRRHVHRIKQRRFAVGTQAIETLPDKERIVWAIKNGWDMIQDGVTTVRDTGNRRAMSVTVRELFNSALVNGPRVVSCGWGIAPSWVLGVDTWQVGEYLEVTGPDEARKAAREQLGFGTDWLKVRASGGLEGMPLHDDPLWLGLTVEEMRAVTDEAHARGKHVCAHAYPPKSIQNCLVAGIDCIEHGSVMDERTVAMMAEHRCDFVPTMTGMYNFYKREDTVGHRDVAEYIFRKIVEPHRQSVARCFEVGVRIGAGTDTLGDMVQEVQMIHESGLPKDEALRTATSTAAAILRQENAIGTLEAGKLADVLVVQGNPLNDLEALRRVRWVFKDGNLVTPDWLLGKSLKEVDTW